MSVMGLEDRRSSQKTSKIKPHFSSMAHLGYLGGRGQRKTDRSEKAMAPHSSTLAWKIPWMEKPGRLQSMGSRRVRHD